MNYRAFVRLTNITYVYVIYLHKSPSIFIDHLACTVILLPPPILFIRSVGRYIIKISDSVTSVPAVDNDSKRFDHTIR